VDRPRGAFGGASPGRVGRGTVGPQSLDPPYENHHEQPAARGGRSPRADEKAGTRSGSAERVSGAEPPYDAGVGSSTMSSMALPAGSMG